MILNGKRKALPVVTGDLAVRRASVSFLLIQAFGAQLLWYLEGPLALISLQPGFANKVTCTDVSCSVLQNEAHCCVFRQHQYSTNRKKHNYTACKTEKKCKMSSKTLNNFACLQILTGYGRYRIKSKLFQI